MQPTTVEVIYVRDLERTVRFYQALGYVLKREDHEGCPTHYSADFGAFLWEFYPAKNNTTATSPSRDRRIFVDVTDFETILKMCVELELARDAVKTYAGALRSVTIRDPDGWRIHVREIARTPTPSVH